MSGAASISVMEAWFNTFSLLFSIIICNVTWIYLLYSPRFPFFLRVNPEHIVGCQQLSFNSVCCVCIITMSYWWIPFIKEAFLVDSSSSAMLREADHLVFCRWSCYNGRCTCTCVWTDHINLSHISSCLLRVFLMSSIHQENKQYNYAGQIAELLCYANEHGSEIEVHSILIHAHFTNFYLKKWK